MNPKKDTVYTDLKYNCDLIVEEILDSVVLVKDLGTGNNHLYGREEFDSEKKRFTQKE